MINDSTIQTPVPTLVLGPQVKHPKSTSTCQSQLQLETVGVHLTAPEVKLIV